MKNQYEIDYQQGYDKANEEWLDRMDKIRAKIEELPIAFTSSFEMKQDCLDILDKYKAETEAEHDE